VLNSPWGTVLGQPLALLGFLAYLTMALLALLPLLPALQTWLQDQEARGAGLAARRGGRAPDLFWQLGTLLALAMAVFSLVLLGLMAFRIHAVCAFCVLSAVLCLALLLLHWLGRDWPDRGQLIFRMVVLGFLVALLGVAWAASVDRPAAVAEAGRPPAIVRTSSPASLALAEHLSSSGARVFTAWWCPHCHEQKELFGRQATAQLKVNTLAPLLLRCSARARLAGELVRTIAGGRPASATAAGRSTEAAQATPSNATRKPRTTIRKISCPRSGQSRPSQWSSSSARQSTADSTQNAQTA